jgi:hypothetical protein
MIFFGKNGNRQNDVGHINAFSVGQEAACNHFGPNAVAVAVNNLEAYFAVVKRQVLTGADYIE